MDPEQFHFLRPAWLLLLVPAALVILARWRRQDPLHGWGSVMAPHLLKALLLRDEVRQGALKPMHLLAAAWLLGALALAGPTWERAPAPFAEDQAAVYFVVKVTPQMLAQDIQPSRLQRSAQKISDFLQLKRGQRTGLIAYAGSAHLAMPLTTDADIIESFSAALEPDIMPVAGDALGEAVSLANARLREAGAPGSIVVLADAIDSAQIDALERQFRQGGAPVHILAMAAGPEVIPPAGSPPAPPLDEAGMRSAARAGGGSLTTVTPDDADVRALARAVERGIADAPSQEGQQWRDIGWYLLPVLALLLLPFFRRGGALVLD